MAVKLSNVRPPTSSEPGMCCRTLYCRTATSAAVKTSAVTAAGVTNGPKKGRRCIIVSDLQRVRSLAAHSRARGNPETNTQLLVWPWVPAFAGTSGDEEQFQLAGPMLVDDVLGEP